MRCPHCGNQVPARPICLRCGASLFGSPPPAMPASALGPIPVPLTAGQQARLLAGCLPLASMVLMLAGYMFLVSRGIVPPPGPFFYLLFGIVLLFLGYQAIQSLRDLVSGVAQAQEDLLHRSWRSKRHFYGSFERLGTLRMIPKVHFQSPAGQRYRVVYSPASKIVWALEPPDQRIRS